MRTSKPITVTLGNQQRGVDARLESGAYESVSEIVRAGLRALEREEQAIDQIMRAKIREALDDDRPDLSLDDVFDRMESKHADRQKTGRP